MINPFVRSERVRRRAAQWFARMQGPATERDQQALAAWLDEDPSHRAAFERMAGHWRAAAGVSLDRLVDRQPQAEPSRRLAWVAASAVALTVAGVLLINVVPPFVSEGKAQDLTIQTATGEIRAIILADGSRLTLDTQSAATVRIDRRERLIRIDHGRARLAYVVDKRPLQISAGKTLVVEGAGTLDVAKDGGTIVVRPVGSPTRILVGDVRHEVDEASPLSVPPQPHDSVLTKLLLADRDWPSGVMTFDNELLGSVIARANRYSSTPIVLDDPGLANERLTGRYRAGDMAGLTRSLAAAFDLAVATTSTGAYRLSRKGKQPGK